MNLPFSSLVLFRFSDNNSQLPFILEVQKIKIIHKLCVWLLFHKLMCLMYSGYKKSAKRPTATLKELQEFLASTGCVVHVTTISHILHMSGLWGRVARKTSSPTRFCKNTL